MRRFSSTSSLSSPEDNPRFIDAYGPRLTPPARTPALDALGCLLIHPELRASLTDEDRDIVNPNAYPPGPLRQISAALAVREQESDALTTASAIDRIQDASSRRIATGLVSAMLQETGGDSARLAAHFQSCARRALMEMQSRKSIAHTPINGLDERSNELPADQSIPATDPASVNSVLERIRMRQQLIQRFGQDHLAHADASTPAPTTAG